MKRLIINILLIAIPFAVAMHNTPSYASTKLQTKDFPYIVGAAQFPENKSKEVRHSLELQIPFDSSAVSRLTIGIPESLRVKNNIDVSEQPNRKINANIAINDKTIAINFPQPVPPGTKLNIDLNRVLISGGSNAYLYPVSAKLVGLNTDIPLGTFRLRIFA